MKLPEDGILFRMYIGESDRYERKPLYEALVSKAKELDLAGATVLRGIMEVRVYTTKLLRLSAVLPLVIEIVDSEEYVQRLLALLEEVIQDGMITLEKVRILHYRAGRENR